LTRPIGYQPKGAVTASFDLNIQGYNEPRGREFEKRFHEKVRAIPGIESAALILIGSVLLAVWKSKLREAAPKTDN